MGKHIIWLTKERYYRPAIEDIVKTAVEETLKGNNVVVQRPIKI